MDSDLLIPLFWLVVFSILIALSVRRLTKKLPTKKKWIRPDPEENKSKNS